MKYLFVFLLLALVGCSSSETLTRDYYSEIKTIRYDASEVQFENEAGSVVNDDVLEWSYEVALDSISNRSLDRVVYGFRGNQTRDLEHTRDLNADIKLKISKVHFSRRNFTINFAKIGPIVNVTGWIEIEGNDQESFKEKYRVKVNMAEVLGRDKSFYYLKGEDRTDSENQKKVLDVAYNKLFNKASSKILGIKY